MANISFNPAATTNPSNTFSLDTRGWIQGMTQDDWASRSHLLSGVVDSGVTQPMWGGMAVAIQTQSAGATAQNNDLIKLATTGTGVQGFTVFDQASNMIQIPGNSVPTAVAGANMAYYLIGSEARIPMPIDPSVLASLEGVSVDTAVYWDPTNLWVTTTSTSNVALTGVKVLAVNTNSKSVNYNAGTSAVTWQSGSSYPLALLLI